MDTKKILSGALIWSVGLLLPMLWHALLMNAAVQESGYSYSYHHMMKYFIDMPWAVWVYLIAMAIIGSVLVVSGLRNNTGQTE